MEKELKAEIVDAIEKVLGGLKYEVTVAHEPIVGETARIRVTYGPYTCNGGFVVNEVRDRLAEAIEYKLFLIIEELIAHKHERERKLQPSEK